MSDAIKVVVINPFSADPVAITGSQNFSVSASAKNDENVTIVRGDRDFAEVYARPAEDRPLELTALAADGARSPIARS